VRFYMTRAVHCTRLCATFFGRYPALYQLATGASSLGQVRFIPTTGRDSRTGLPSFQNRSLTIYLSDLVLSSSEIILPKRCAKTFLVASGRPALNAATIRHPLREDPMAINPHHRRISLSQYTNFLLFPEDLMTTCENSQRGATHPPLCKAEPDSATLLSLERLRREWPQLRRRLGQRRRALESILAAARPIRLSGCTLIVGFPPQRQFHRELLTLAEYKTAVEEELARMCGLPLTLMTVLHPEPVTPAQLPPPCTSR
jgi:hypothetical protein